MTEACLIFSKNIQIFEFLQLEGVYFKPEKSEIIDEESNEEFIANYEKYNNFNNLNNIIEFDVERALGHAAYHVCFFDIYYQF